MRKHQVPLEPSVESEEQIPTNFVSMFMRQKRKYRRAYEIPFEFYQCLKGEKKYFRVHDECTLCKAKPLLDIRYLIKKKKKRSLSDIKTYNTLIINLINNETPFT